MILGHLLDAVEQRQEARLQRLRLSVVRRISTRGRPRRGVTNASRFAFVSAPSWSSSWQSRRGLMLRGSISKRAASRVAERPRRSSASPSDGVDMELVERLAESAGSVDGGRAGVSMIRVDGGGGWWVGWTGRVVFGEGGWVDGGLAGRLFGVCWCGRRNPAGRYVGEGEGGGGLLNPI